MCIVENLPEPFSPLADGVDIITADQRQKEAELVEAVKEAGHVPIISMPKSIPCNDVYGVSEEEANL